MTSPATWRMSFLSPGTTLYIHPRNKTMITAYVKPSPEKPRKKNNNY